MARLLPLLLLILLLNACTRRWDTPPRVLIFSRTSPYGYRHESIDTGKIVLMDLCRRNGIVADTTENQLLLKEENLRRYSAVIFLSTNGEVLDPDQEADFERYIQAGGGFAGIHSTSATEYTWRWFGGLMGAYFKDHPAIQEANIQVADCLNPITRHLGCSDWHWKEEWYNFRNYEPDLTPLLTISDSSYQGGATPEGSPKHLLAWQHEYDGGRAFYTALGHIPSSYGDPIFQEHLLQGILYAIGENKPLNYARCRSQRRPDQTRFVKTVAADHLSEPMELAILPDQKVLFIERHGYIKLFDPKYGRLSTLVKLPVYSEMGDGLIGMTLDPKFSQNNWLYLYYSSPRDSMNQLSRFVFRGDTLDRASEKVILTVPVGRHNCFHAAGSMTFGPDGLLYLATGDNTSPFASDGYAPIDGRPGRKAFDARRSSGNTNDLRGKVLRIRLHDDGTYECPTDNLYAFAQDTGTFRKEIYVMGCRNPFRISVDQRRNYLYWGDIGPDAGKNSDTRGPMGHDEINQARTAGNHGWPLLVGNNQAYRIYDFETGQSGDYFDPLKPFNNSPNNTGCRVLPPARSAFIWYPYSRNRDFPMLGEGGRNAMAGPTYYSDAFPEKTRFPDYYHDKTIIYDWMRGWLMAVTVDSVGNFNHLEPFADSVRLSRPMDMAFAADGALWVLEYGQRWYSSNDDARLSRIEWVSGNRPPVTRLRSDVQAGGTPLEVTFNWSASEDYDRDKVSAVLDFGDGAVERWSVKLSKGRDFPQQKFKPLAHTYTQAGLYRAVLRMTDASGKYDTDTVVIAAGNTPPVVTWELQRGGSRSFYKPGDTIFYQITVQDNEDGSTGLIPSISADYVDKNINPANIPAQIVQQPEDNRFVRGKLLVSASDCYNCHAVDKVVNGPSFQAVAERYRKNVDFGVATIYRKIIYGGSGNWGQKPMAAHPNIREEEAIEMTRWILALGDPPKPVQTLPQSGVYPLTAGSGTYILKAGYQDKGLTGGIPPLFSNDILVLRPNTFEAENCDTRKTGISQYKPFNNDTTLLAALYHNTWFVIKKVDIKALRKLTLHVGTGDNRQPCSGGRIEIRLDKPDGPLFGQVQFEARNEAVMRFYDTNILMDDALRSSIAGRDHDLYFVFMNEQTRQRNVTLIDWIRFE